MMLRVAYTLMMAIVAGCHFYEAVTMQSKADYAAGFLVVILLVVFWMYWIASDRLEYAIDLLTEVYVLVRDVDSNDDEQVREAGERILERFNKEGL